MKKCIFFLALSLILSISLGWDAIGQMPKEGRYDGVTTYAGTHRVFPIDKEHFITFYENTGVRVDDSGGGPFHKVATHNMGIIYSEKGVARLRGYFSTIDKDGDKVLWELTETESKPSPPNQVKGTGKIIWGTGKFTGIQGSMEYTRGNMRPVADGTHQGVTKDKGNWKLP